ncbi:conserved hypothetical protein [Sporisorium reilianum SRZ2]|uniref:Uncharacterized protein n=1 Tax=Sporisorium reilianum (strain SRZ2) TaxID=999809 RepID=E6ZN55_SPORE|nr:conserved hypothetical protein [Sporisorium reilianum SRZ2]
MKLKGVLLLCALTLPLCLTASPPSTPSASTQVHGTTQQTSTSKTVTDASAYSLSSSDSSVEGVEHSVSSIHDPTDADHSLVPPVIDSESLSADGDPSKRAKQIDQETPRRRFGLPPRPKKARGFQPYLPGRASLQPEIGSSSSGAVFATPLDVAPLSVRPPSRGSVISGLDKGKRYHSWWRAYREAHPGSWPNVFAPSEGSHSDQRLMKYIRYTSRIQALDAVRKYVPLTPFSDRMERH